VPPFITILVSRFNVVVALDVTPIGYSSFVVSSVVVVVVALPFKSPLNVVVPSVAIRTFQAPCV